MRVTILAHDGKGGKGSSSACSIAAPPSKSMAHRMLICAGLADGTSTVRGIAFSDDILATIDCLRSLGAEITELEREGACEGAALRIKGTDPRLAAGTVFGCRESGSTLRFMIPLAALSGSEMVFNGSERLMERPLTVYEDLFRSENISFERIKTDGDGNKRIMLKGVLGGGEYLMDGSISSQFISGMLFALPLMRSDSILRLIPPVESRPYIDMTLQALRTFGIRAGWEKHVSQEDREALSVSITGGQSYRPADLTVEGDWSNAAFLTAMGYEVTGLRDDSLQGDKAAAEYFGMIEKGHPEIDISSCPDLGPVLMAYAALHKGCTLTGTRRLRIKESDRGRAMKEELAKFGVRTYISDNSIEVGCGVCTPAEILCGHNDHRVVMALSVICARTGGTIDGAEAVNKSFPDFFERISAAGTNLIYTD